MAIFGTFEELLLIEVLPTLIRRNGKLLVWGLPSAVEIAIHLQSSKITALLVDQQPLELIDAYQVFRELFSNKIGHFEFFDQDLDSIERHFDISLSQLLVGRLEQTSMDNLQNQYFPDPQTRFVTTNRNHETYLGFGLDDFWTRAYKFLLSGANAAELAERLGLHVTQAQGFLYRLRASGRIQPLQAFRLPISPNSIDSLIETVPALNPNVHLPSTLSTASHQTLQHSVSHSQHQLHQAKTTQRPPEKQQKAPNILGRLLKALGVRG
jgi:hypothetical protein